MLRASRWLALLVTLACVGTETGNPPLDGTLSVNAHSSDSATAALRSSEGGAVVEELWLGIGEVVVEPCTGGSFVVPDLGIEDHAGERASRHAFLAERTAVCRLRVRFVRADAGPDAIRSRSTLVRGRDALGTPFEIGLPLDEVVVPFELELELDEARRALLLAVDVARWVGELDLASGATGDDGVVHVDESRNPALRDAFLEAAAGGFEVYRDDDADGVADIGEPLLGRGES